MWIIKNEEDRKRFIRAATLENINTLPAELQLPALEDMKKEVAVLERILKKDTTNDVLS